MNSLKAKILLISIITILLFLGARFFLNNIAVETIILVIGFGISIIMVSNYNSSIKKLKDLLQDPTLITNFHLDTSNIKIPDLNEIGETINQVLDSIYKNYIWKQGVVDELPMCCIICDEENKILYVNQEIIDFVEQDGTPEDFIGMSTAEFFYGDPDHPTITGRSFKENKKITGVRTEVVGRKGRKVFTEINAAPFYDPQGNLIGSFAVFNDLTELKREQDKVLRQAEILKAAIEDATGLSSKLTATSEDISSQIESVNSSMEQLKSRAEEVATAMEEMNSTVLEVSKNAASAAEAAEHTANKAEEGSHALNQAIELLEKIKDRAQQLQKDMEEMEKQAEGIGEIINTISDIADQTNLLALNAAIEAARAGDAGRGFAVVADEVRKLAEKTMTATKDVEEYIYTIQNSAKTNMNSTREVADAIIKNMEISKQANELLKEMVELSDASNDQIRSIATAAEQQSAASEQITRSTEEVNNISQQTMEITHQTSESIMELNEMIQQLNQLIKDMEQK